MSDIESTEMNDLLDKFEQDISNKFNLRIKELENKIKNLENENYNLGVEIQYCKNSSNDYWIIQNSKLKVSNNKLIKENQVLIIKNQDLRNNKKFINDIKEVSITLKSFTHNDVNYYKTITTDNILYDENGNAQGKWDETTKNSYTH